MTVMAAVALGGLFSGCSKEMESVEGSSSVAQDIVANYETAFITRFGQPAENQTWGFGPITSGTRAEVLSPSITEIGYSFNAQMAKANYSTWSNSGWRDKFYQVNGNVVSSDVLISPQLKAAIKKVIVGTETEPGLIPEQQNNKEKAQSTGYSIVTQGGPVTLTPVYHQSSSGDMISYYYYKVGTTPDVKVLPKYSIGNMADPEECKTNIIALNESTYSLVYVDENGNVSYNFPAGYVINFIVTNTDMVHNGTVEINDKDATLTSQGKYALTENQTIPVGTMVDAIHDKLEIRFGRYQQFAKVKSDGSSSTFDGGNNTTFTHYTPGNEVNANLKGGSTVYYFKPKYSMQITLGVKLSKGKTMKVVKLTDLDATSGEEKYSYSNTTDSSQSFAYTINVDAGAYYAVYAEGSKLGLYGFVAFGGGNVEKKNFTEGWGPFDCGLHQNFQSTEFWMGKPSDSFKAAKERPIDGYSYYTSGTDENGSLTPGDATTYYFYPKQDGVLRVGVVLNADKAFYIKDLGTEQTAIEGTSLKGYDGEKLISKYYGTYDFDVQANHVYAVYAEGSKLGFYGCEFFTKNTSASPTKYVGNNPDFYGDGAYNTEIHNCALSMWNVDPDDTPHAAVFNSQCTDENGKKVNLSLIGFEDWTDLDFNDVIFAVTGTAPEDPPVIIEVPDSDPEPVCRIIAEDLTVDERGDFDFNDVVFDVCPDAKNNKTILIIRAVGGELPLYVAQSKDAALDESREVHKVCNIGEMSMTNTGWDNGGKINYNKECGRITLNGTVIDTRAKARDIKITVVKKKETIELSAVPGRVPSKICVGTDYKWCFERTNIDDMYHTSQGDKLFSDYVVGYLGDDWYKNVQTDQSGN